MRLAGGLGRHADPVLILAFTGLRSGEAIALTVADIEFLKRRITVASQRFVSAVSQHTGPRYVHIDDGAISH